MPVEPGRRLARGHQFEEIALKHLEGNGLRLLTRNFKARGGEIDLVMAEADTVVFVEVRSRTCADPVEPIATVTLRKRSRVIRAAQWFLLRHPHLAGNPCRFDVVGITGTLESHAVTWLSAAFTA